MPDSTLEDHKNVKASQGGFEQGNQTYALPRDSGEHSRLDLQHEVVKLVLEGRLYPAPELVHQALAQRGDGTASILDVGTGSGRWAVEISEEFPDVKVIGIDLALPSVLSDTARSVPSNCSFQVADANQDLAKLDLTFNVIHMRFIEPGINTTDLFFYDVARLLRPEGTLLLVSGNAVSCKETFVKSSSEGMVVTPQQIVDDQGNIFPLRKPGEAGWVPFGHMHSLLIRDASEKRTFQVQASLLEEVSVGPPAFIFWMGEMRYDGAEAMSFNRVSMLEGNPNYSRINVSEALFPIGPWLSGMTEAQRKISETMQKNLLLLLPAFKAIMLRDGGFPPEFTENLFEGSRKELEELPPAVHGYSKLLFVTAVRSDMPWVPRTQPWQDPPSYDLYDYIVRPLQNS